MSDQRFLFPHCPRCKHTTFFITGVHVSHLCLLTSLLYLYIAAGERGAKQKSRCETVAVFMEIKQRLCHWKTQVLSAVWTWKFAETRMNRTIYTCAWSLSVVPMSLTFIGGVDPANSTECIILAEFNWFYFQARIINAKFKRLWLHAVYYKYGIVLYLELPDHLLQIIIKCTYHSWCVQGLWAIYGYTHQAHSWCQQQIITCVTANKIKCDVTTAVCHWLSGSEMMIHMWHYSGCHSLVLVTVVVIRYQQISVWPDNDWLVCRCEC